MGVRRRERAKMIDKPPPPRPTLAQSKEKSPDELHEEIMRAWDAVPARPRSAPAARVSVVAPATWRVGPGMNFDALPDEAALPGLEEALRREAAAARGARRATPRNRPLGG